MVHLQILGEKSPASMTSDILSGIMTLTPMPERHAWRIGILRKPSRWGLGHLVLGSTAQGGQSDLTPAGIRNGEPGRRCEKEKQGWAKGHQGTNTMISANWHSVQGIWTVKWVGPQRPGTPRAAWLIPAHWGCHHHLRGARTCLPRPRAARPKGVSLQNRTSLTASGCRN